MDVKTVCKAVGGIILQGSGDTIIEGYSIDTRSIKKGDLFFALKGKRDGHQFVQEALSKGAAAAVIEKKRKVEREGNIIGVDDPLKALQDLASYVRSQFQIPVIAITGSNGKTTTKDMVAAVLSMSGKILKSMGNFNNEIGMPLSLLGLNSEHRAVVLEMGMRGLGQIDFLCKIARPTVGVITNIGVSHFELLGSLENISRAKGELLTHIPRDGFAVLNKDDPRCCKLRSLCKGEAFYFGIKRPADFRARKIKTLVDGSMEFTVDAGGKSKRMLIPVPGEHNIYNALAAIGVGYNLGLGLDEISEGLSKTVLSGMRLEIKISKNGVVLINDSYNANPSSMKASLKVLKNYPGKRKIAVLGDMLELGKLTARSHREVGKEAAELELDYLITLGPFARYIAEGARECGLSRERVFAFEDQKGTIHFLRNLLSEGDVVLIKASRGMNIDNLAFSIVQNRG